MKPIPLVLVTVLATPIATHAQSTDSKTPTTNAAPRPAGEARTPAGDLRIFNHVAIGEDAPDFELSDANGSTFRLSHMRGRGLLLTFANQRGTLPGFGAVAESLNALGVTFVGICHDSPQSLRSLAERTGVPYLMLSDPTGEISAIYGAYDALASSIVPGFVLVGPRGKVRMVFLGESLPPAELLALTRYSLAGL
jgi:peroxiredoxin Q/BCP